MREGRCGHHSRTLLSTLDSREMFASGTAALRTPPCLFLYAGARADYTVKYTIKYMAAVKQLIASRPSLSLYSISSRTKFGASYRHICHWQHRVSPKTYVIPPVLTIPMSMGQGCQHSQLKYSLLIMKYPKFSPLKYPEKS